MWGEKERISVNNRILNQTVKKRTLFVVGPQTRGAGEACMR